MRVVSLILLALFVSADAAQLQKNAYAKFDSKGRTIGLYNLLADTSGCENSQLFSGVITKVTYEIQDSTYTYTFTLNANGKRISLNLIATDDEILQPDVEDIILKNLRVRVRARRCGSSAVWTTEEVRRL